MANPKRATRNSKPASQTTESGSSSATVLESLVALRNDCLTKLNDIATQVQQRTHQVSAHLTRAVNEAQFNAQLAQHERLVEFQTAAQSTAGRAGSFGEWSSLSQQCARDLENAQATACKSIEEAQQKVSTVLKESTDSANRDWDAACSAYVRGLQEVAARLDPGTADPQVVAAIGQSMMWVASQLRRPGSA